MILSKGEMDDAVFAYVLLVEASEKGVGPHEIVRIEAGKDDDVEERLGKLERGLAILRTHLCVIIPHEFIDRPKEGINELAFEIVEPFKGRTYRLAKFAPFSELEKEVSAWKN